MIFYFSGTGNTKWAAKHVAARLNEELKFIPDELSTDMTYTVSHKDLKRALTYTEKVCKEIGAQGVEYDDQVAKVSVIGVGMRNHSGVAAMAFSALHKANINILMISTSEIKISCLIKADQLDKAVHTLHSTFGLDGE